MHPFYHSSSTWPWCFLTHPWDATSVSCTPLPCTPMKIHTHTPSSLLASGMHPFYHSCSTRPWCFLTHPWDATSPSCTPLPCTPIKIHTHLHRCLQRSTCTSPHHAMQSHNTQLGQFQNHCQGIIEVTMPSEKDGRLPSLKLRMTCRTTSIQLTEGVHTTGVTALPHPSLL